MNLGGTSSWRERVVRAAGVGFALVVGVFVALSGAGAGFDRDLRSFRDGLHGRSASGEVVIVEIDAKSLAAESRWPWPRSHYADFINRVEPVGVHALVFDVDFSSRSDPANDTALADALEGFGGGVILPTFRQVAGSGATEFIESLPIPQLRSHAFLASVNVHPGADGVMRSYPYGTVTGGTPRPSVAAMLAERPGRINEHFTIDFAIDPATIPRVSFVDVLEGRAPVSALKDKRLIVGATAIELGDRYAVPRYGVLPGVVIQALAAETLIQNATTPSLGPWPLLLLAAMGAVISLRAKSARTRAIALAIIIAITLVLPLVLEVTRTASLDSAPALAALAIAVVRQVVAAVSSAFRRTQLSDNESGLPNAAALVADHEGQTDLILVAARFARYDEASSVLAEADRAVLVAAIADRLRTVTGGARIHRGARDVFLWAMPQAADATLEQTLLGLAAIFRTPMYLDTRTLVLKPTFGVARTGPGQSLSADLLAKVELAAAQASQSGEAWREHDEALSRMADEKVSLLSDIEKALAERHLWVAYQPKLDLAANQIVGAEALVRWDHPDKGPQSPAVFVPLLEAEGHALELTMFVLDRVLEDMADWRLHGQDPAVAINVSATLLRDASFAEMVVSRVRGAGIAPERITIEVTESAAVASAEAAVATLERMRDAGLRISVDDYGTGQSTLTYLKSFPAHEIKIDQSFVRNMTTVRHDEVLVRSTIGLAHELGLKVVAEGIEDVEALQMLRELGCDTGQGWAIGRPVRGDDFIAGYAAAHRVAA